VKSPREDGSDDEPLEYYGRHGGVLIRIKKGGS